MTYVVQNIVLDEAVTVIGGEPGAGKTFLACQLAADAIRVLQCRVVLATSGLEPPELLRWRLDQVGADTRRVALVSLTPKRFTNPRAGPCERAIDERIEVLRRALLAVGDPNSGILPAEINSPRLLVIDDVDGWFGGPGQCLSAATVARVIQHLNQLARSLHVAVVVLARTPMSAEGRITSKQLRRLSQSASVVWLLVKDKREVLGGEVLGLGPLVLDASGCTGDSEDPGSKTQDLRPKADAYRQNARRWLLPVKTNLVPDAATGSQAQAAPRREYQMGHLREEFKPR